MKSPFFILGVILIIIVFGYFINSHIKNSEESETIEGPVVEAIPYTNYNYTKITGLGYLHYEDDNYTSKFGIDVSAHQETINWKKVKEAGVEFAYIRLGYRGAVQGLLNTDLEFENNYYGALKNNIDVGVYWYAQPISVEEAIEEANYVLKVLDNRHLDLPIVLDFEETEFSDGDISRMHGMSPSLRCEIARAFCDEIIKNHHEVMIYTNLYWGEYYYDSKILTDYPIWLAEYNEIPTYDKPFRMWQYSESGAVPGIEHPVDLDIMFICKNDQN